jgi:hypothetical protein
VAIRELAVLLRNALAAKTQDAHKEVYCWQVRTGSTSCSHALCINMCCWGYNSLSCWHVVPQVAATAACLDGFGVALTQVEACYFSLAPDPSPTRVPQLPMITFGLVRCTAPTTMLHFTFPASCCPPSPSPHHHPPLYLSFLTPPSPPPPQTLMCLELWVKVLTAAAPRGTLSPLVYPTTQLLLGAARLVPTPRYFPIRLRLVRVINSLEQVRGVCICVVGVYFVCAKIVSRLDFVYDANVCAGLCVHTHCGGYGYVPCSRPVRMPVPCWTVAGC